MKFNYEGYEVEIPDVDVGTKHVLIEDAKHNIDLYNASMNICQKYTLKTKEDIRKFLTDAMLLKNTIASGIIKF